MSIEVNVLNKLLANQIQKRVKIVIHYSHVRFVLGIQVLLTIWKSMNVIYYTNRVKIKNYMIILIDVEKAMDKIQ